MTPTEHNSHLAGDLNAPRPQRSLLAQARLTDAEIDELDRLEGSAHPNWSFDDELKGIANAATRKAFEVLEQWLEEKRKYALAESAMAGSDMSRMMLTQFSGVFQQLRNELHAQLHQKEAKNG